MARYRSRGLGLRPIQRIKHVVDFSATLAKATDLNGTLVNATDTPILANTADVITGSKVHAIYIKVQVASNDAQDLGALPQVYLVFFKNPGGNLTIPNPQSVGADDNKRYVIHQEMAMIENKGQGGNPITIFNGVITIPKGYQRFGPGDILQMKVKSVALDIVVCWQAHYKEFR